MRKHSLFLDYLGASNEKIYSKFGIYTKKLIGKKISLSKETIYENNTGPQLVNGQFVVRGREREMLSLEEFLFL